jgi:hypothetical protein
MISILETVSIIRVDGWVVGLHVLLTLLITQEGFIAFIISEIKTG